MGFRHHLLKVKKDFVYLSLITDANSQMVVDYDVGSGHCMASIKNGLEGARGPFPELVSIPIGANITMLSNMADKYKQDRNDPLDDAVEERVNGISKDESLPRPD